MSHPAVVSLSAHHTPRIRAALAAVVAAVFPPTSAFVSVDRLWRRPPGYGAHARALPDARTRPLRPQSRAVTRLQGRRATVPTATNRIPPHDGKGEARRHQV